MLKVVRIKTRNQNHQKYLLAPQKMENAPAPVQRAAVAGTMSSLRSGILSRWCLLVIIDRVRDQPDRWDGEADSLTEHSSFGTFGLIWRGA